MPHASLADFPVPLRPLSLHKLTLAPRGSKERQMLILTRKIDQGIIIAGNIHVRVLGVERDRVKIGISAPKEVTILRDELVERDQRNNATGEGENTNSVDPDSTAKKHEETPTKQEETPATSS